MCEDVVGLSIRIFYFWLCLFELRSCILYSVCDREQLLFSRINKIKIICLTLLTFCLRIYFKPNVSVWTI